MSKFEIASDGINPNDVPKKVLHTGDKIPAVGLGTFGSDRFTHDEVAEAVKGAISVGYRHIDCASVYGNEDKIGAVLSEVMEAGVPREELWITSNVWNNMHGDGDVLLSCAQSLKDLKLEYLDLYLVHWPFPNYHAPGCSGDSRCADAKPYIHENFMKTWRQMERLVEAGLVRNIGTSNMTVAKMNLLLRDAKIKPTCNEMELHPHFQQPELFDLCMANGIQPIGFCPIGSPTRPDRDKTEADTCDIQDPTVLKIAEAHNVHPAVICLKWAYKRGHIPIPFSVFKNEYLSNLNALVNDPITDEEMAELAKIDRNCRLIKGQVFLWKDGQTWEDLWDANGVVTPA